MQREIKSEWININDREPQYHQKVLFISNGEIISGVFTYGDDEKSCIDDITYNECFYKENITFWMPLPELPTQNKIEDFK